MKHSLIIFVIASCALVACDNKTEQVTPISHASKKYAQTSTLEGVVSNQQGRIKSGQIKVTAENQQLITETKVEDNGQFHVVIPADTQLPVILTFYPDSNQTKDEQFIAVAIDPMISKYDINPLTTAIANKAKAMGGYTRNNLTIAAQNMVSVPDANKTSTGFRGDPTTQYGGWH
jgi:apolipoprotein N-acyltransferase